MPHRLTILYGQPEDPAEFDRYYQDVHLPLARRMPSLTGWTLNWTTDSPDGTTPEYRLIVDLYAPSKEAMLAILDSPEGRAAAEDVGRFATGGVTFLHGAEQTLMTVQHGSATPVPSPEDGSEQSTEG